MTHDLNWYRRVFEQMPGYFFMKDRESRFIGCNRNFAEFAGETMDTLLGKSEREMPWKDQPDHFMGDDRRVMDSGVGLVNYREPKHGHTIVTNKFPFVREDGSVEGVIGNFIILGGDRTEPIDDSRSAEATFQHYREALSSRDVGQCAQAFSEEAMVRVNDHTRHVRMEWTPETFFAYLFERVDTATFEMDQADT